MNQTFVTRTMQPTKSVNAQFLAGVSLLLCALTFYYFAVLRIDYSKTTLLDLGPYPDATEYFAQAKALRRDGWPSIQIGYDKLPSRYPFGYPAMMLPWLKILSGRDSGARFRFGTVSDESNAGSAAAVGRVCFLRISGDAANGWVCGTLARDTPGLLHFLSFVTERSHCLVVNCPRLYVCLSGS